MDGMDWYMITVIIVVAVLALFFGLIEHLETMAGCLK